MISFNAVLRSEGLAPSAINLMRHQDKRHSGRPTPYQLWRAADGRFELYQSIQRLPKLHRAGLVASFVAAPLGETLFVGLFIVKGVTTAPPGLTDPISNENVGGLHYYDLVPSPHLADYRGKLVVEWGPAKRAWHQWAKKHDKPVLELRRTIDDPPFPGFLDFRERLSNLAAVPPSWREVLSAVGGVYLLTCPKTEKNYVGSAHGVAGFWGRWQDYVTSGHGGNKRLREVPDSDYQVTVLEVAASSATANDLAMMENRWKQKLLSREFGLNAN